MRRRLQRLQRVQGVQARIHALAERRLAQIEQGRAAVERDRRDLVAALDDDAALQGLFVDAKAKRLIALARKADELGVARDAQSRLLVAEGLKLKLTERRSVAVRKRARDADKRKTFEQLLQVLRTAGEASSR